MNDKQIEQFELLCDRFLDNQLSPQDEEKVTKTFMAEEEARQIYVRRATLLASLQHYASEMQSTADGEEHALIDNPQKRIIELPLVSLKWAALLIGLLCSGALLYTQLHEPAPGSAYDLTSVAVLLRSYNTSWSEGVAVYQAGDSVPVGEFQIESGVVQLEFYNGATLVLEGRTSLNILEEGKVFCHYGRVTVSVSPHARGFSIATADLDFVDLGTEFGLEVAPGKPSELHVFSGEVEVYKAGQDDASQLKATLTTGDAASFVSGVERIPIQLNLGHFWDIKKLVYHTEEAEQAQFANWKGFSKKVANMSGVISYFPFYQAAPWVRQIQNTADPDTLESCGAIVGCSWEEGRWSQKSALRFNNPGDRVRFNIPGEYESITLAAWIKVESLKNLFNGLFMTDAFLAGNPHWQFNDQGQLILGVRSAKKIDMNERDKKFQYVLFSPRVITPERLGQWIHVASTFDTRTSQIKHYLNGECIIESEAVSAADTLVRIGKGELGNWGLPYGRKLHRVRNFDGALDEMLLVGALMSEEDIMELYQLGKPGSHYRAVPMIARREER